MATFTTRNGRTTAQIRKVGPDGKKHSFSGTFGSEGAAREWAASATAKIQRSIDTYGPDLPHEIAFLPRFDAESSGTGVYFLFRRHECVYVGQSLNVHVRVREHRLKRNGAKQFDSYSFLPVRADRLSEVEAHYIGLIRPRLNESMNPVSKARRRLARTRHADEKAVLRAELQQVSATRGATSTLLTRGISPDSASDVVPIHHRGHRSAPSG